MLVEVIRLGRYERLTYCCECPKGLSYAKYKLLLGNVIRRLCIRHMVILSNAITEVLRLQNERTQ